MFYQGKNVIPTVNKQFNLETWLLFNLRNRKRKGTHQKIKRVPDESTHKHMETWNSLAITDAFLDQKRVNVSEHAVMMASTWGEGRLNGLCLEDRMNW